MSGFDTLWGDINFPTGKVIEKVAEPAATEPKEGAEPIEPKKPVEPVKPKEPVEGEEGKEEDGAKGEVKPSKPIEPTKPVDPIEFSDDDVNKAFTMLVDEGVIDEPSEDDEFEASPKGLADLVALQVRKKFNKELQSIPEVVQQFYAHVNEGNDPIEFIPRVQPKWEDTTLSSDDAKQSTLKAYYVALGMDEDKADEEVEDAVSTGKLDKKANDALDYLIDKDEKDAVALDAQKAKEAKKAEEDAKKEHDTLVTKIDGLKDVAGFSMDVKGRRDAFKDYLFKVDRRSGKTQMQKNMMDEDRRLKIAFMDFIEFNKGDVTKEVKTSLAKENKKRLARYTDKNTTTRGSVNVRDTKVNKGAVKFPKMFDSIGD